MFFLFSLFSFSQNYGSIEYMGKSFYITSDFFQRFNTKYEGMGLNTKYRKIYYATVDFLKIPTTDIKIDEAKRISYCNPENYLYAVGGNASKSDRERTSYILYKVLLPVIEEYAVYAK